MPATQNNIRTSKSAPYPFATQRRALFRHVNFQKWSETVSFNTFDSNMRFAPERRALFRHVNFQTWSEHGVLCTFSLRNVLCATTACTFFISTSKSAPNVRCFSFCKRASRHNGVQLFISHLARLLRTRRFSEPTFRPPGATNQWKNTMFRDFPTFSRTWILSSLILLLLFSSLLLLFPSLLFICPFCRKFDF